MTPNNLLKNELAPDVPFCGLTFNWDFVFAFIAGSIIIMIFAWRRFREHSYDQKSLDYRVMQHLAPTDLRARSPMGRAYFVYVSCILFVYLSLTFFGELIFHLLNMSPVAGIQMDTSNIDLDNPNWPLTLAFAGPIAGRFADQKEVLLRRQGKGAITAMASWIYTTRRNGRLTGSPSIGQRRLAPRGFGSTTSAWVPLTLRCSGVSLVPILILSTSPLG